MAGRAGHLATAAALLASALLAVHWWPQPAPTPAPAAHARAPAPGAAQAARAPPRPDLPLPRHDEPATDSAHALADPLLTQGVRYTLEALLAQAGEASDPSVRKQRLAGLMGNHFPEDQALRALALAERYVDYRVALGALRVQHPHAADPHSLEHALAAREHIRRQFFDDAEYAALFAREVALDRYTLARQAISRTPGLTPAQRDLALQATDALLPPERLAQRHASTAHLAVAAQTQAFEAQHVDSAQRHAVRSAQYGEAAAQALARLDQEEQHWQQRLTLYQRAQAAHGSDSVAVQQLRAQLFSEAEWPRIDAALALRERPADEKRPPSPLPHGH